MILLILGDWWNSLSGAEQVFWAIAIVFTVLFIIQFVLSLIGLDFDGDADFDISTDAGDAGGGYSLDADFTLFSVRSIIAFFTFFGWTGVLVLGKGVKTWIALSAASLSGLVAMFIVGYMMYLFSKLTQEGNINIKNAINNTGEVYLTVPANKKGFGKIHLKIQGAFRELDAVTNGDALPTGASVRIVEVLEDNLLLVEPMRNFLGEQQGS